MRKCVVGRHIQELRDAYRRQAQNLNLTKVPDAYQLFTALAQKFKARFSE
jgi:hypothetical protein